MCHSKILQLFMFLLIKRIQSTGVDSSNSEMKVKFFRQVPPYKKQIKCNSRQKGAQIAPTQWFDSRTDEELSKNPKLAGCCPWEAYKEEGKDCYGHGECRVTSETPPNYFKHKAKVEASTKAAQAANKSRPKKKRSRWKSLLSRMSNLFNSEVIDKYATKHTSVKDGNGIGSYLLTEAEQRQSLGSHFDDIIGAITIKDSIPKNEMCGKGYCVECICDKNYDKDNNCKKYINPCAVGDPSCTTVVPKPPKPKPCIGPPLYLALDDPCRSILAIRQPMPPPYLSEIPEKTPNAAEMWMEKQASLAD